MSLPATIERGGATVAPLGVPAGRIPVLNVPLEEAFEAELRAAGCSPGAPAGSSGPFLAAGPGVFANAACVRALVEAAGTRGGRLVLRAPGWARFAGGPDARPIDLAVVPAGGERARAGRAALPAIEIDADEAGLEISRGPESLAVAMPRRVACEVRTWPDALFLNLFTMSARVRSMSPAKGLALVSLAALRALSLNKWRVAQKLVAKGPGCDVHPSATVEASVLGAGVRIGPGAVVRNSVLGDGAEVEELALVVGSVVGPASRVQRQAMLKFCVAGAGAALGGTAQLSLFGDGSAMRLGSYTLDRRLDGSAVSIRVGTALAQVGPALGCALGPGASVGSGVWIGAGREVPAGVVLVRAAEEVLTRIPDGLSAGVYAVEGGTAVPVARGRWTP